MFVGFSSGKPFSQRQVAFVSPCPNCRSLPPNTMVEPPIWRIAMSKEKMRRQVRAYNERLALDPNLGSHAQLDVHIGINTGLGIGGQADWAMSVQKTQKIN